MLQGRAIMQEKPLRGSLLLSASTSQTVFQRELFHTGLSEIQHYFLVLVLWHYYLLAKASKDIMVTLEPCLSTGSLLEAQAKNFHLKVLILYIFRKRKCPWEQLPPPILSTFAKGWWHMEPDAVRQGDGQMALPWLHPRGISETQILLCSRQTQCRDTDCTASALLR